MGPDGLSDREWALWRALSLMGRTVQAELERALQRDAGLSSAEFEVLYALSDAPERQARARELADMLAWEKSRVSHLVTRMTERGYVARAMCETDLRGTWVSLTPAGSDALTAALPGYVETLRTVLMARVSDAEASFLTQTALSVVGAIGPDVCVAERDRIAVAAH